MGKNVFQCTIGDVMSVVQTVRSQYGQLENKNIVAVELSKIPRECLEDDDGIDLLDSKSGGPKDYTKEDILWAAETFKSIVVPHILKGGTRQQFASCDSKHDNSERLRKIAPIWDLYLKGTEIPLITLKDDTGQIAIEFGRHRTRAAQVVGIRSLPMQTRSRELVECEIDAGTLQYATAEAYFSELGIPIQ